MFLLQLSLVARAYLSSECETHGQCLMCGPVCGQILLPQQSSLVGTNSLMFNCHLCLIRRGRATEVQKRQGLLSEEATGRSYTLLCSRAC